MDSLVIKVLKKFLHRGDGNFLQHQMRFPTLCAFDDREVQEALAELRMTRRRRPKEKEKELVSARSAKDASAEREDWSRHWRG